jgi:hypothetical protein
MSIYVSYICQKHGLLKRTVNSIRFDIQGRMKSLMELKKTELKQVIIKISVKEDKIADIKAKLDAMKPKAIANTLTDRELGKYRSLKTGLYWQKNKLNKLQQHKDKLEYQITNKIYDMCYGSKAMFDKQYRCQTANCGRRFPHFDFVTFASPTALSFLSRHIPDGVTA